MADPELSFSRSGDATLVVRLAGPWHLRRAMPSAAAVEREIESAPPRRVAFDAGDLGASDSGLLTGS